MDSNKFNVDVNLIGQDGNAFMVLGLCQKAARNEINQFIDEAKKGDYDHLLRTCMKYFNVK